LTLKSGIKKRNYKKHPACLVHGHRKNLHSKIYRARPQPTINWEETKMSIWFTEYYTDIKIKSRYIWANSVPNPNRPHWTRDRIVHRGFLRGLPRYLN